MAEEMSKSSVLRKDTTALMQRGMSEVAPPVEAGRTSPGVSCVPHNKLDVSRSVHANMWR